MIARALPPLLAVGAVLAVARPAAAVSCSTLPNSVLVAGSGDVVVNAVGKVLAPGGVTVLYLSVDSCIAVDAILNGTVLSAPKYPTAVYFDATGAEQMCTLDAPGDAGPGLSVEIGVSDVFATTCMSLPNGLPNGVQDFFGPVEAHTLSVPKMSDQKAISKKAGYFVYGFGAASGADPWTNPKFIFQRGPLSGTQQMIATGIGVPPDKWLGTLVASSGAMVSALATSTDVNASIGILTAEVAQANASEVSVLAFQDEGQTCAYFPDSTQTARDKVNVRDGHYALWGPEHMHTYVDSNNQPNNPVAREVIAYIEGTLPPPTGVDFIALFAQSNLVPQCAMKVQRASELGALMSASTTQRSCGCYFDEVTTGTNKCKPCTTDSDCPTSAPRCNYEFCETH